MLPSLMKGVWTLVVPYSGPFGLTIYRYVRTRISHDSVCRRGFRSTAHCYSGCGPGEIVGVLLAQAILGLAVGWVAAIAFANLFGYALTGVLFRMALAFSLSLGFVAAFPVNVLLVKFGVKEG